LSQEDGALLKADITGGVTTVDVKVVAADYELANGTSFSGPHVAGVAALVKSANPNLSAIEVRKIIEKTAEPIGPQVIFGAGMVRADRAVEAALAH
jgi:subtilisin family serine protease